MPPLRTPSLSAMKPTKTERTHEENQERAYIAASRRSDRSLEARVESARRASEIHKRRTGRSLRVTEQDVVNEEMYEEEDDDLPMQYRRLTAHLQTSNADFDRRLAAYLTNHVAMRTALGQAVQNTYNQPQQQGQQQQQQQYPNSPQFANNPQAFQLHLPNKMQSNNSMLPPQNRSPSMYRQSPYPIPNSQGFKSNQHNRSISNASPNDFNNYQKGMANQTMSFDERRLSMPFNTPTTAGQNNVMSQTHSARGSISPTASRNSSSSNLANLKFEAAQQGLLKKESSSSQSPPYRPASSAGGQGQMNPTTLSQPSTFPAPFTMGNDFDPNNMNPNFFSTALPMESQQLLSGAFDLNDPMTAMLMGGDPKQQQQQQQPFYSYNPNENSKKSFTPPTTWGGMDQTLAPGMLDTSVQNMGFSGPGTDSTPSSAMSPFAFSAGGFGSAFDSQFTDPFKPSWSLSGQNSGEVTPSGERDWANLIDGNNVWEEQTSSQVAGT